MTVVSPKPRDGDVAHAGCEALAQLRAWRDEKRVLYVFFLRSFVTGASTAVSGRGKITQVDARAIEVGFEHGVLNSDIADADFIDGPLTLIDIPANAQESAEAVQIKLRGGDELLLATREIDATKIDRSAILPVAGAGGDG